MDPNVSTRRPAPLADQDTAPFWEAARSRRLVAQFCESCAELVFPPKPYCPECLDALGWKELSGRGKVYSFCISRMNFVKGYQAPYAVAWISLDEDETCIMNSNILDCAIEDVRIGMPVEVVFEERPDGVVVPQFRPTHSSAKNPSP